MRTFTAFATLSLIATLALAAPHNKPNANKESNSFSGAGGNATGGSVESIHPSNERFQGTGLMSLIGGSVLQMNASTSKRIVYKGVPANTLAQTTREMAVELILACRVPVLGHRGLPIELREPALKTRTPE